MVDAWIRAIGVPDRVVQSVVRALRPLEVCLQERGAGADHLGNGVIAFGQMTPAVADTISEALSGRSGRILALAATCELKDGEGWDLLRAGASDVVTWRDATHSALHIAGRLRRWRTVDDLVGSKHVSDFLVGDSSCWQDVLRDAVEAARFTDAAVLITGESGTGKERVAHLIHELDPRLNKSRLVVLDASNILPTLSGSEFFGHERGAFTGALAAREGAFEMANGGTLFLDEVGELPVTLQAELLRVIQEGTFKRVGSNTWRRSTFRLVCATNHDLAADQAKGAFRRDFYYRIAGCTLHLPSLRERTEDIIPLFRHFFGQVHPDHEALEIEEAVRDLLLQRTYPGNVRDLRSLALRIAHRHLGDGHVTVGDIPEQERPMGPLDVEATWCDPKFEAAIRRSLLAGARVEEITAAVSEIVRLGTVRHARSEVERSA
jgi:transcriptional regulator with GAF, ATPase, and Fis domain